MRHERNRKERISDMKMEAIGRKTLNALDSEKILSDPSVCSTWLPGAKVEESNKVSTALPGNEAALSMRCRSGLPGIEVEKRFRSAAKTMQRSEAAAAFYLAEIDERRLWLELGYSSVIAYAAEASDIAAKKTYALLNIGRRLRELPVIRAAFDEGRIGWTKVRDILRLKGDIDENEMLDKAQTSTSRELEQFVSNSNGSANRKKWKSIHQSEENQAGIFDRLDNADPDRQTLPLAASAAAATSGQAGGRCSSTASEASGLSTGKKKPVRSDSLGSTVSVTLKFTPEEYAIYLEARRVWKRKNRSSQKQERMVVSHARRYLEEAAAAGHAKGAPGTMTFSNATAFTANEHVGPAPAIVDSPYNIYIHHCPECGKNSMTGKNGDRIGADEALFEKALCDGAAHTVDKRGFAGRKKRSVSPALRKKIFMRDGGVCRVPGCGKTSSLEVHHVKPLSAGGGNSPANLLLCCSLCRYRHKLHYADFRIMPIKHREHYLTA